MTGHIFLIGFMGAGKSTVAHLLAEMLELPEIDLDARIVARAGRSIPELFAQEGEDAFRDLETQELAELSDAPSHVVACGGGVVIRSENRAALKRMGVVVYLRVTAGEALARIGDAETRPLLAGGGGALAATALLSARENLYRSVADITVDTVGRDPQAIADQVAAELGSTR